MLSIFSCASWPSVYFLWRNVCLGLLPVFWLDSFLFFGFFLDIELHELFVYFGDWPFFCCLICKYFFSFWRLSFRLVYGFLCCAKAFKFTSVPFVYFCFYIHYCRRWVEKRSCFGLCQSVFPMSNNLFHVLQASSISLFYICIPLYIWKTYKIQLNVTTSMVFCQHMQSFFIWLLMSRFKHVWLILYVHINVVVALSI